MSSIIFTTIVIIDLFLNNKRLHNVVIIPIGITIVVAVTAAAIYYNTIIYNHWCYTFHCGIVKLRIEMSLNGIGCRPYLSEGRNNVILEYMNV